MQARAGKPIVLLLFFSPQMPGWRVGVCGMGWEQGAHADKVAHPLGVPTSANPKSYDTIYMLRGHTYKSMK